MSDRKRKSLFYDANIGQVVVIPTSDIPPGAVLAHSRGFGIIWKMPDQSNHPIRQRRRSAGTSKEPRLLNIDLYRSKDGQ
jgi:hypothetical protein